MIDPEQMTAEERRFWAKVDVQRLPDGSLDFDKCWEWRSTRTRPSRIHKSHPGYGQFRRSPHRRGADGRRVRAHRFAWEHFHGRPVPEGLDVAHEVCDHPPCCNPTHVVPMPHNENQRGFLDRYGSPLGKVEVFALSRPLYRTLAAR
jgi:hypothetical protein